MRYAQLTHIYKIGTKITKVTTKKIHDPTLIYIKIKLNIIYETKFGKLLLLIKYIQESQ